MQFVRNAMNVGRQALDLLGQLADPFHDHSRLNVIPADRLQLDREQRQALAQVIVKLAGKSGTLFLLSTHQLAA
jgi:hypothetical protein